MVTHIKLDSYNKIYIFLNICLPTHQLIQNISIEIDPNSLIQPKVTIADYGPYYSSINIDTINGPVSPQEILPLYSLPFFFCSSPVSSNEWQRNSTKSIQCICFQNKIKNIWELAHARSPFALSINNTCVNWNMNKYINVTPKWCFRFRCMRVCVFIKYLPVSCEKKNVCIFV